MNSQNITDQVMAKYFDHINLSPEARMEVGNSTAAILNAAFNASRASFIQGLYKGVIFGLISGFIGSALILSFMIWLRG